MLFFGAHIVFYHPVFVQQNPGKIFKFIQDFSHFNHPPAKAVPLLFLLTSDRRGKFVVRILYWFSK
jgi:hypothetical protein